MDSPDDELDVDLAEPVIHIPTRGHSRSHSGYAHASQQLRQRHAQVGPPTNRGATVHHVSALKFKKRKSRSKPTTQTPKEGAKENDGKRKRAGTPPLLSMARLARSNMTLLTTLGEGRLDPFDVYPQKNLPHYIQALIDHTLNHVINAYLATDHPREAQQVRSMIIGEVMSDPLMWYPVMMSGITHYAFVHQTSRPDYSLGENYASKSYRLLRLSYKTQTLAHIRADIERNNGVPSEAALLAMSTLMSHGCNANDDLAFTQRPDPIQMRKAFGTATDMHYYSSITFDTHHWFSLVRYLLDKRGGMQSIKWPLMQQALMLVDTTTAWRRFEPPSLPLLLPTSLCVGIAGHRPDELANMQMRRMLSGLPLLWRTSPEQPHAGLYQCLQHMRTIMVRYNQYQRRHATKQTAQTPDVRLIIYTRSAILHDLLELSVLTTKGTGVDAIYELVRHGALAVMQLVLFPIASVNETPRRVLEQLVPLLELCRKFQLADEETENPSTDTSHAVVANSVDVSGSLVLWVWMLAGMLAVEHFQATQDYLWMDRLAPFVEDIAIKAEKSSWSLVKDVMETFLWLESECDGVGKQWWIYACLSSDAKRRERERNSPGLQHAEP